MIRLAITDDHPSILEGLKTMFANDVNFALVGVYTNGKDTIKGLANLEADILLLDVSLPDLQGDEVCKQVLQLKPELGVIAFTSFKDTAKLRDMLGAGAKGFLLKNSSYDDLYMAIMEVFSGKEYLQAEMKDELINESLHRSTHVSLLPKLTRREKEILQLILDEMTTQEIADKLFISFKTVETHRLNLLQKLGVKNTAGLVRIAIEQRLV